ncbi:hypothetical protein [Archangium lipolyticum]|uniref:hypothetical protein n=1 Tax=Archangium lipolyticum TaxID=2970465 RepID=UPI00214A239B|nr:hypothetical protein [Archangium lipolyticum]
MFTCFIGPRMERVRWRCWVLSLVALVSLVSCTTTSGTSRGDRYGYDNSASAACRQNPANCIALTGKEAAFEPIREVGTVVASSAAVMGALDDLVRKSIEDALVDCANMARSEVLLRYPKTFEGPTPNADECKQWTVDARGRSVTWAVRLGMEMHDVASQCAQEELSRLRPGGFSVEQRYRYDGRLKRWKQVSAEEEQALIDSGNAGELKGTLKPDVVIHSGDPVNVQAVYDFKFPCANTDRAPEWDRYPENHPYEGSSQRDMYMEALGPEPVRIVPRLGVIR